MSNTISCSPSRLDRRYLCPGSGRLEASVPKDQGPEKDYTVRGRKLHQNTYEILRSGFLDITEGLPEDDQRAVDWCVYQVGNIISEYVGVLPQYEVQVNLDYLNIPAGKHGNRIDLLLVIPGEGIVVVDYKYGVGWTDPPKYSWQLKAYGWGAWTAYGGKWVRCIKLQPELDEDARRMEWTFQASEMAEIGEQIKEIVQKTQEPDAPLVRGDKQCQFCRARDICPAWRGAVMSIPRHLPVAAHLRAIAPDQRGKLYEEMVAASKWLERALKCVYALAVDEGLELGEYELRCPKQQEWRDITSIQQKLVDFALEHGKNPQDMEKPATVISPSGARMIFGGGKTVKDWLAKLVVTHDGNPQIKRKKV